MTYEKDPQKTKDDIKRKLGDLVVASVATTIAFNTLRDRAKPKVQRVAGGGSCVYCQDKAGTFSATSFYNSGKVHSHSGCRCYERLIFENSKAFEQHEKEILSRAKRIGYDEDIIKDVLKLEREGKIEYEKPLNAFLKNLDTSRDLVAHAALAQNGFQIKVLAETAPRGYSNIDIAFLNAGQGVEFLEIKSPNGKNIRAVEDTMKSACKQFAKHETAGVKNKQLLINGFYYQQEKDKAIAEAIRKNKHYDFEFLYYLDSNRKLTKIQ